MSNPTESPLALIRLIANAHSRDVTNACFTRPKAFTVYMLFAVRLPGLAVPNN